jgi:hypothetical protein
VREAWRSSPASRCICRSLSMAAPHCWLLMWRLFCPSKITNFLSATRDTSAITTFGIGDKRQADEHAARSRLSHLTRRWSVSSVKSHGVSEKRKLLLRGLLSELKTFPSRFYKMQIVLSCPASSPSPLSLPILLSSLRFFSHSLFVDICEDNESSSL